MPETTTTTTPTAARPPFTGSEDLTAVSAYIAAKLTAEAGHLADGRPRFRAGSASYRQGTVIYTETGLVFTITRNTGARAGVTPYLIACSEGTLNPHGATGAHLLPVKERLHANGDCRWSKIHTAALIHAQRHAEVMERQRIARERQASAWDRMATFVAAMEAQGAFPTPTARGSLEAPPTTGYARQSREWVWEVTPEVSTLVPGITPLRLYAALTIDVSGEIPEGWEPATHVVSCSIGFARYESADCRLTLREAFALVSTFLAAMPGFRAQIPTAAFTESERAPRADEVENDAAA